MWWKYPFTRGKHFSFDIFFFNTQSCRTLPSFGHYYVRMHTNLFNILCFFCQGKSRDIFYQRICLFLWLIFAQHGLFEIQLTVYSALSRLTDLGLYYTTRCGIWLLTIFHIPYIHFQRELRKVTSPTLYLSFFVSVYMYDCTLVLKTTDSGTYITQNAHLFHTVKFIQILKWCVKPIQVSHYVFAWCCLCLLLEITSIVSIFTKVFIILTIYCNIVTWCTLFQSNASRTELKLKQRNYRNVHGRQCHTWTI